MMELLPAPATLAPGQRVYAIGDIHGCLDRLVSLHEQIAEDIVERPAEHVTLVHLGDYVDRGTDSAQVVDWLISGPPVPADAVINLMGNHEHMMLAAVALADAEAPIHWLSNGGGDSLVSWGIDRTSPPAEWAARFPQAHLLFLRDLAISHRVGPYLFVHAGVRPGVPLDRQSRHDMMWIRDPFLTSAADFGAVVVHGHTPKREPAVTPNRIAIDTGAVLGGALTAVMLEGDRLAFLQA
ncbi:MAG TPA: metallophosphoesterase family protein [Rhodopila sp.]|uniref:metallophosphoesterase family protein n=1 Tax=Rhodopila sp. TaxID=2480087 RepID=UPI002CE695BA|nr:metallophosphoesterase family protein [Rhodopila sp.]HVY14800.1 metallophosphoesterase family protein [Rhodopila sp.]